MLAPCARSVPTSSFNRAKAFVERREIGDLAADMHVHAARLDIGQLAREPVKGRGLGEGHAELVLRLAGRDLVVGLGVDVGIDAHGDAGGQPARLGHLAQRSELGLGFHVEGEDAGIERKRHLGLGLADAGEHDPLGRDVDGEGAAKLALRHHVHAGAGTGERGEHAERWSWP